MTKKEFVKTVAKTTGYTQGDVIKVINATFDAITEALVGGDEVAIQGFGKFVAADVAEKKCNDIKNPGQTIVVPAHKSPKFKASEQLKAALK